MQQKPVHPAVFVFLILPFGVLGGYLSVAVARIYADVGMAATSAP